MESTNEAIEFGNWILKELQENDELHSEVWDFNGELITTKELYKRFTKAEDKNECDKPCGMNYCDENGCTNRKRDLVDLVDVIKDNKELKL
jgi:hypothetical protein